MESHLQKMYALYYNLACFPYTLSWEPGLQIHFSLKTSSKQYKLWFLATLIVFCHMLAVWFFLFHKLPEYFAKSEFDKLAFHSIWAACSISTFDHEVLHLKFPSEIMQLANGNVGLIKNLETSHFQVGSFQKSQLLRAHILYFLGWQSLTSWTCFIFIYYLFRQEFWQLGSFIYRLVLNLGGLEFVAAICSVLTDVWYLYIIWGSYLLSLHLNLGFMHTFKTTVSIMLDDSFHRRKVIRVGQVFNSKLDRLTEHMLVYAKLRILTTVYNNVYGIVYVPTIKTVCVIISVMTVFISIRLAPKSTAIVGIFGIVCSIMCTFCLTIFILFMSMVNEYSVKFGKYLKGETFHGPMGRRLVRSYREEAVKSGEFYNITRMTCLTVLALLSNISASVLISFTI